MREAVIASPGFFNGVPGGVRGGVRGSINTQ